MFFTTRHEKTINKKQFFNEKHNKKIKYIHSRKKHNTI